MSLPTSATGISTELGRGAWGAALRERGRDRGFTLLELLVVCVIIALFAGAAVLSMGLVSGERDIEREVLRFRSLLELVREEALLQSRDFAVLFSQSGYRFFVFDHPQQLWVDPPADALLSQRALRESIRLDLRVEDQELVLPRTTDEPELMNEPPQPQIMVLSTGEITAFEADFYRDPGGGRITLTAEIGGATEVSKEGFDDEL